MSTTLRDHAPSRRDVATTPHEIVSSFMRVYRPWWKRLHPDADVRADRGARAELRRAESITDVCFVEAFAAGLLPQVMELEWYAPRHLQGVALLAGLSPHMQPGGDRSAGDRAVRSYAQLLGTPPEGGSRAPVAPARFRKMLNIRELDDLFLALKRMLRMTKGACHAPSMARACLFWSESTRKQWAIDYYTAIPKQDRTY